MTVSVTTRIRAAVQQALEGHSRVLLAVSGGIDSMVLLDAAAAVLSSDQLVVATFDHATGAPARAAASHVMQAAASLGIDSVTERADRTLATEAAFRDARWDFLRKVAGRFAATVCTAHTRDDQIETVFMRVLRHAGPRGLAALYADSDVSRPLLGFARADIVRYAAENRLSWVEDPSNASTTFLRNRVRHELLPALRRVRPAIDTELLATAMDAARWRRDVERVVALGVSTRVPASAPGLDVDLASLVNLSAVMLRLLLPPVIARAGVMLDRRGVVRLADFAVRAKVGARMQLSGGWDVVRSRDALQLRASSATKPTPAPLALSQGTSWCGWSFRPATVRPVSSVWSAHLPTDRPLVIRSWRAGDKMRSEPSGRIHKVKTLLSKAGVTGHDRAIWPVVVSGDDIVWIPGVRRSDAATDPTGSSGLSFLCEHVNR